MSGRALKIVCYIASVSAATQAEKETVGPDFMQELYRRKKGHVCRVTEINGIE